MSPGALVKFHVLVQDSFVGLGVHLKRYYEKIFVTWSDHISYQEMAQGLFWIEMRGKILLQAPS